MSYLFIKKALSLFIQLQYQSKKHDYSFTKVKGILHGI